MNINTLHVADLNTQSPVNAISIDTQNKKLIAHLGSSKTINFIQARAMGIAFLNSRVSDLKKLDHVIHWRWITINKTRCKEYSFNPFNN